MKHLVITLFLTLGLGITYSQTNDTLRITYLSENPYAFEESGELKGIEVDILKEYVAWLKVKKSISVTTTYKSIKELPALFNEVKLGSKNTIGLGSLVIKADKDKSVDYTTPYLKHAAFCVTNGNAPDIKSKNRDEIVKTLGNLTAVTMENTSLSKYCTEIKKQYATEMKIIHFPNEQKMMDEIARNVLYFGYVDAITFWVYLKNNPRKTLKMQKALNQAKEELGFIMPKGSKHKLLFDEFFNGPTGFRKSPTYQTILEKYLGAFMAKNVSIN